MARERKQDLDTRIERLSQRHHELSARVAELERYAYLSQSEHDLVTTLKREKLAAKDALEDLRRSV